MFISQGQIEQSIKKAINQLDVPVEYQQEFYSLMREYQQKKRWRCDFPLILGNAALTICRKFRDLPLNFKIAMMEASFIGNNAIGKLSKKEAIEFAKYWEINPTITIKVLRRMAKLSKETQIILTAMFSKDSYFPDKDLFWAKVREAKKYSPWFVANSILSTEPIQFFNDYLRAKKINIQIKEIDYWDIDKFIYKYVSENLEERDLWYLKLGTYGKATIKAARGKSKQFDFVSWAGALAWGKPDLIQKILSLQWIIPFTPDAVPFLMSCPEKTMLRLLSQSSYKVHGEDFSVSYSLVKEASRLWLKTRPEKQQLGRIRCWYELINKLQEIGSTRTTSRRIIIREEIRKLDRLSGENWQLRLPKLEFQVIQWGRELDNCLKTICHMVGVNFDVVGVFQEGKIRYAIRIEGDTVVEFRGFRNSEPPPEIFREVILKLIDLGFYMHIR